MIAVKKHPPYCDYCKVRPGKHYRRGWLFCFECLMWARKGWV